MRKIKKKQVILSDREIEILQEIADGKSVIEIAIIFEITESTARRHVVNILVKLDAHTKAAAVAEGFRRNLLK